jgi:hypothetical protein
VVCELSEWLCHNTQLRHLDISYNQLTEQDLRVIEDGLRPNRTLVGLHIEQENLNAYVDALGFICFEPMIRTSDLAAIHKI